MRECRRLVEKGGAPGISRRIRDIAAENVDRAKVLAWYKVAQPYIDQYLPNDSYRSLLLLIGLVMLGVAFKGFFMFLQEVAGRRRDAVDPLRHPQRLLSRRSINLDLASFSDQGSSELMARFTNDMDSFGQGLNTLMSKVIREPLRFASCLGGALWFNWRLTCLTLILVPIFGCHDVPRGQDHEAGRAALAREHVHDLQDPSGELPGHQGDQGVLHRDGSSAGGSSAKPRTSTARASAWR